MQFLSKEMEDASANVQVRKLKVLLKKAEDKVMNHDKVIFLRILCKLFQLFVNYIFGYISMTSNNTFTK